MNIERELSNLNFGYERKQDPAELRRKLLTDDDRKARLKPGSVLPVAETRGLESAGEIARRLWPKK